MCNFGRRHHKKQFCEFIWNLDQGFRRRCCLKIFYPELWQPLHPAEQNHLCNFGRAYPEEKFCEIILNLDLWFRMRCCLKDCLSGALSALMFSGAKPLYESLVEGIMGNSLKFGPKLQFLYLRPILSAIFELLT